MIHFFLSLGERFIPVNLRLTLFPQERSLTHPRLPRLRALTPPKWKSFLKTLREFLTKWNPFS